MIKFLILRNLLWPGYLIYFVLSFSFSWLAPSCIVMPNVPCLKTWMLICDLVFISGSIEAWFWVDLAFWILPICWETSTISPDCFMCANICRAAWLGWMGEISPPFPYSEGTIDATFLLFLHALAAQIVRFFINFWNLEQNIQTQSSLHWLCSWKGLALGVTRAPQRRLIMQSRSQTWSSTGASSLKKSCMWTLALWKKISWKMSPMMSTARWNARVRFWQYLWLVCRNYQRVCAPILFSGSTCSIACWATRPRVRTMSSGRGGMFLSLARGNCVENWWGVLCP